MMHLVMTISIWNMRRVVNKCRAFNKLASIDYATNQEAQNIISLGPVEAFDRGDLDIY